MSRPFSKAMTVILLVSTFGCREGPGAHSASTYDLVRGDGKPLPLPLVMRDTLNCSVALVSGGLEFKPQSRYSSKLEIKKTCVDSIHTQNNGVTGPYTRFGDTLYFLNDAQLPAGRGLISGDSIVVAGTGHLLTFRKKQ